MKDPLGRQSQYITTLSCKQLALITYRSNSNIAKNYTMY